MMMVADGSNNFSSLAQEDMMVSLPGEEAMSRLPRYTRSHAGRGRRGREGEEEGNH